MKQINDITVEDVKSVLTKKGYRIFTDIGVPNIVGIRNVNESSNQFIDRCWVWWTENGIEQSHNYTITTRPGFYYLENPIAGNNGTGILVPNQYIDCWELGMHRQKQFALCQRDGVVQVYRDNDKDDILDLDPKTIQKGYFGVDMHHAGLLDTDIVNNWSAACQVWRYHIAHQDLMQSFKALSAKYGYNKFSYTLLNQVDF
jgi:hypothetical protein